MRFLAATAFAMSLFFLLQPSYAALVQVEVPPEIMANISSFSQDISDISSFKAEFYDTGSTPYVARLRIDVFDDSGLIFTGWSSEKEMIPGRRTNFEMFWYTERSGKFDARLRAYFANEILEQGFQIDKRAPTESGNVFEFSNFRTYDDFVVFDVSPSTMTRDVVIIPEDYPLGWIFEQGSSELILPGSRHTVVLPYKPSLWLLGNVTILVTSDGGRYASRETFQMKKEEGLQGLVNFIIDSIKTSSVR